MDCCYREAMTINYVNGDATAPIGNGTKVVVHICNDAGKWGKGFVLAISKRWPKAELEYRAAFARIPKPSLGDAQIVGWPMMFMWPTSLGNMASRAARWAFRLSVTQRYAKASTELQCSPASTAPPCTCPA